ncbi:MAG: 16S rRNA (guanine(527)-N(7))-methyltransferase RsmG [Terracidiphilus sp.]
MDTDGAAARLNALLEKAGIEQLDSETAAKFAIYLSLILRWNARLNLTSLRTEDVILSIHLVDSVACARAVPSGVRTLLDFGSGAGLPGIPIALCRPEIAVTLAESQGKKAAFLQEAVRTLGLTAKLHADRAEALRTAFDCVVLRAVDKMPKAVASAAKLVAPAGWLALMTTNSGLGQLQAAAGSEFVWSRIVPLPNAADRIAAFGSREPA